MNLKYYFENAQLHKLPVVFSSECIERSQRLKEKYGEQETHQVIYETVLTEPEATCDISFRVDTGKKPVENYWLEFDYAVYSPSDETALIPCTFLDASCLKPNRDPEEVRLFLRQDLTALVGQEKAALLTPSLLDAADQLDGKCTALFQVGSMDSRAAAGSVRIYTREMKPRNILSLLSSLSWPGDPQPAQRVMDAMAPYAFWGSFTLSFDLFPDRISEKIGIEFLPRQDKPGTLQALLAHLADDWDCLPEKCDSLMDWNQIRPIPETMLQNDISHIKFTIAEGEVRTVKAYLRQRDAMRVFSPHHRAHRHPQLMNLEVTTRCSQCYAHLNTGEEMELDTALYWLREGKAAGIRTVCLSGGETLCYPHLPELIRECRKLGLTSAIALSGIYADKACLRGLIEDGVNYIYITLNGSRSEIDRRTPGGYQLAVDALQNLKELGFEHTGINWVMSRENAQDLPDMIALCERYDVRQLVLLAFKPDSVSEWERFPSAAQMEEASRQIKAYRGPVEVEAEACFSQMKALLGRSALAGNLNRSIQRGCCAGRDQISVSVDGKLTPCRHLDYREEYDSIMEYWENSPFLAELRRMEDKRREPCLGCRYEYYCLPCNAVGYKLQGEFTYGLAACELGQRGDQV